MQPHIISSMRHCFAKESFWLINQPISLEMKLLMDMREHMWSFYYLDANIAFNLKSDKFYPA